MPKNLSRFDVFSGVGGISLAAESAGFTTVGFCEIDEYATKVLQKHWPDVPIFGDIKKLTKESFYERTGLRTAFLVSFAPPCQPASVAGKRRGDKDDRWLWGEAIRIVREIQPTWAIFENPYGIITLQDGMAFEQVLSDLENEGYEVHPFVVPACAVDAPHRRDRIAIIANSALCGRDGEQAAESGEHQGKRPRATGRCCRLARSRIVSNADNSAPTRQREHSGEIHADTEPEGLGKRSSARRWTIKRRVCGISYGFSNRLHGNMTWPPEPDIPRVVTGQKNRKERLRCLGNAVCPPQFAPFFASIAEIERNNHDGL